MSLMKEGHRDISINCTFSDNSFPHTIMTWPRGYVGVFRPIAKRKKEKEKKPRLARHGCICLRLKPFSLSVP